MAFIALCMLQCITLCLSHCEAPMLAVRRMGSQKAPAGTLACSLAAASASLGISARNSFSFACIPDQHTLVPI